VFGITKPTADIETITSPIHLKTGNLTKEDLFIFLGGTKDISSALPGWFDRLHRLSGEGWPDWDELPCYES